MDIVMIIDKLIELISNRFGDTKEAKEDIVVGLAGGLLAGLALGLALGLLAGLALGLAGGLLAGLAVGL